MLLCREYIMKFNLKIGQRVRLKGGGPEMTITNIVEDVHGDENHQITCHWFTSHSVLVPFTQSYPPTSTLEWRGPFELSIDWRAVDKV